MSDVASLPPSNPSKPCSCVSPRDPTPAQPSSGTFVAGHTIYTCSAPGHPLAAAPASSALQYHQRRAQGRSSPQPPNSKANPTTQRHPNKDAPERRPQPEPVFFLIHPTTITPPHTPQTVSRVPLLYGAIHFPLKPYTSHTPPLHPHHSHHSHHHHPSPSATVTISHRHTSLSLPSPPSRPPRPGHASKSRGPRCTLADSPRYLAARRTGADTPAQEQGDGGQG